MSESSPMYALTEDAVPLQQCVPLCNAFQIAVGTLYAPWLRRSAGLQLVHPNLDFVAHNASQHCGKCASMVAPSQQRCFNNTCSACFQPRCCINMRVPSGASNFALIAHCCQLACT